MKQDIDKLINEFVKIKNMGWVMSIRKGSRGVSATFEHLLRISKNNFDLPDYNGILDKNKKTL